MMHSKTCYPDEYFQDYLDGVLPPDKHVALSSHLADCTACRFYADELRQEEEQIKAAISRPLLTTDDRVALAQLKSDPRYKRAMTAIASRPLSNEALLLDGADDLRPGQGQARRLVDRPAAPWVLLGGSALLLTLVAWYQARRIVGERRHLSSDPVGSPGSGFTEPSALTTSPPGPNTSAPTNSLQA